MKTLEKLQETRCTRGRIRRALGLTIGLAIVGMAATPVEVLAQGIPPFVWNPSGSFPYDNGALPSLAVQGTTIVEVHQSESGVTGPLFYHTGQILANGTVQWAASSFMYDNGAAPSVAVSGTSVIEVHQSDASAVGPLYYHTGKIQSNGTITWAGSSFKYDNGAAPSVAVAGSTIVEVHQGQTGVGPLWYRTGEIQLNGTVKWDSGGALKYDNGAQPRVAIGGSTILEVHQADSGVVGTLYYHAGEIQANSTVLWAGSSFSYDTGIAPSIAVSGPTVVEVHQAVTGVGSLYYHTGGIQGDGTVTFSSSGAFPYDTGLTPGVAVSGPTILDVHQSATGVSALYYHTAAY
ncbi:MAG: hypothetical protein ABSF64_16960 [Bryobacteraceae bacterium]|jgi:hypothetical protein